MITDAVAHKYLIGVDTNGSTLFGLPGSHAYTVMGAYPIKDAAGKVVARLMHVRNPWAMDYYSGPWNDGDTTRWTAANKAQVPYVNGNDGSFFIEVADFVKAFYYFQIGYVHDDWNRSYYEVTNDNGAQKTFTFSTTKTQDLYVQADFYDSRMYSPGCKTNFARGSLSVYKGSTLLRSTSFTD